MAADVHIYIQDAFQESRRLSMLADEMEERSRIVLAEADELMSVWRGASANRVAAALYGRAKDAHKLAENLSVISDGLYRTAQVYQDATRPGNRTTQAGIKPDITVPVQGHSYSGGGTGGGGGSGW